ncbi:MAG: CsbD family protein [Acidimicrobiales bacterium]
MSFPNVDLKQLRGLVDKVVGLNKEAVGRLLGNDNLADEGQAQQDRGTSELKALRAEVKADAARAEAQVKEKSQRVAQKAKEKADA